MIGSDGGARRTFPACIHGGSRWLETIKRSRLSNKKIPARGQDLKMMISAFEDKE
jgi:hypothetical protein